MEYTEIGPVSQTTEPRVDFQPLIIVWYPQFMHTIVRTAEV